MTDPEAATMPLGTVIEFPAAIVGDQVPWELVQATVVAPLALATMLVTRIFRVVVESGVIRVLDTVQMSVMSLSWMVVAWATRSPMAEAMWLTLRSAISAPHISARPK